MPPARSSDWSVNAASDETSRAAVLHALSEVERTRWAPESWDDFRKAVFGLRAAALVAGASRTVVDQYIELAQVAQTVSDASFEEAGGDPESGGINTKLANAVRDAAENLADHLWHPFRRRRAVKAALEASQREVEKLRVDAKAGPYWSARPRF